MALKVGRTELSARLTVSHSGAIAGEDAVYDALFDRYGVHRVHDLEELSTALILFAQPHAIGAGGLVSIHDSGGERQLLIDLAHAAGVPLTELTPASTQTLTSLLDPGLPAVNPLDAWSTGGPDYHVGMQKCFSTLLADPGAAIGAVIHDRVAGGGIHASYIDYLEAAHAATGKPAVLVANAPRQRRRRARRGHHARGISRARRRAAVPARREMPVRTSRPARAQHAARRAAAARGCPTAGARGSPKARSSTSTTRSSYCATCSCRRIPAAWSRAKRMRALAARELGYPVVLKTAVRGADHKTELDGVRLDLRDEAALLGAYRDLARRLGPRVAASRR